MSNFSNATCVTESHLFHGCEVIIHVCVGAPCDALGAVIFAVLLHAGLAFKSKVILSLVVYICACRFPPVERMGQQVLSIEDLTHGYQGSTLFKNCDFAMEKFERVALMGKPAVFPRDRASQPELQHDFCKGLQSIQLVMWTCICCTQQRGRPC